MAKAPRTRTKANETATARPRKRTAPAAEAAGGTLAPEGVVARFYCQGIGDCHLLKFLKSNGDPFWMLIDCGVHSSVTGGPQTIASIVADISTVTQRLDVIVATHEHWDHISGFLTSRAAFANFEIGEVWMAWTENPADTQARDLDKFKSKALKALEGARLRLNGISAPSNHLSAVAEGLEALNGFQFGAQGEKVRAARDALVELGGGRVRYLEPQLDPLSLAGLDNLRIFVMGPPRDPKLLGVRERKSEMYGAAETGSPAAEAFISAFEASLSAEGNDAAAPFDPSVGAPLDRMLLKAPDLPRDSDRRIAELLRTSYLDPVAGEEDASPRAWRRIDDDWLGASAELAIQLDDRTNNSSLVLAFQFIDTGRVLLFAADAQVGNWLSWQGVSWKDGDATITGPDLLKRTVFYKVGHHGSENATLKQNGLELMTDKDFSAFIPTNARDALKVRWGAMPFNKILDALTAHAGKRVIRADDPWISSNDLDPALAHPSGSIRGARFKKSLWVELDLG